MKIKTMNNLKACKDKHVNKMIKINKHEFFKKRNINLTKLIA
jgi:hypothetical protein